MGKNSKTNHAAATQSKRHPMRKQVAAVRGNSKERGAALATALIVMSLLAAISMTVLAVVTHESRIAGSDLQRTQTFYAAAASIEKMTSDFCALYAVTSRPSDQDFLDIAAAYPTELTGEGFAFTNQSLALDPNAPSGTVTIPNGPFSGLVASVKPYLLDTTATQVKTGTQVRLQRKINNYLVPIFQFGMFSNHDLEVHPGPAFSFNGRVHANGNLYISGTMTFLSKLTTANELVIDKLRNDKPHAATMAVKVGSISVPLTAGSVVGGPNISGTTAGQRGYFPTSPSGTFSTTWNSTSIAAASTGVPNQFGGQVLTRTTGGVPLLLPMQIEGSQVREIIKRMMPNDTTVLSESRYHYKATIRILIDDEYSSTTDAAAISSSLGVNLSSFDPIPLPNASPTPSPTANGGGRALWRVNDNNTSIATSYNETTSTYVKQQQNGTSVQADTVRGVKPGPPLKTITNVTWTSGTPIKVFSTAHGFSTNDKVFIANVVGATSANGGWTITKVDNDKFTLNGTSSTSTNAYTSGGTVYSFTAIPKSPNGTAIPSGSGVTGHILIQIVDANGTTRDVTREILSMGMTEGEPNAIVMLQRPVWAAFTQGSRDASATTASPTPNPALNGDAAYSNSLTDILTKTHLAADGEIRIDSANGYPTQNGTYGYLTKVVDTSGQPVRSDYRIPLNPADWGTTAWEPNKEWNSIVPINLYNVREGRINTSLSATTVFERGVTNVLELNMRNLARWVDGVYDVNLLQGTNALSANIACPDGYTVYVSDRRGDKVKTLSDSGVTVSATNGMVDNEDIYGPNDTLDEGEDVQNTGVLVKDITELPDPAALPGSYGTDVNKQALTVSAWTNLVGGTGSDQNNHKYFRNSVRIFNGEDLQVTGGSGKLSTTKGITISSENMVYIWGNFNTTGINAAPPAGTSSLNDSATTYYYLGNQVPTSIVCDAFFPLSKTFFDSQTSLYPGTLGSRPADNAASVSQQTSVRAAIIAGNNLSALTGTPDAGNSANDESRLCGGMHNFPRFLESWGARWNFVGSLIPLYHSVQAVGQYNANSTIYGAPVRNWAFDITFTDPLRLPPGTPMFQHIEPTGFRQVL